MDSSFYAIYAGYEIAAIFLINELTESSYCGKAPVAVKLIPLGVIHPNVYLYDSFSSYSGANLFS
jgi:hypothetical protein